MPDTATPDVPAEVSAALRASADLAPTGPAPRERDERVTWWERNAQSDEVAEQAYRRLHLWAIETEQPPAVTSAVREAAEARRRDAQRLRLEAERVKETRAGERRRDADRLRRDGSL